MLICLHPLPNDRLTLKAGCQAEFLLGMGDKYKKTSLGAPLAIAYSIDDRLQFDLRYNFGLTDILKDEATNVSRDCVVLSAGNLAMTYSADGNILSKTNIGQYYYDGAKPHAVTSIDNDHFLVSDIRQTATYNS